jgi:Protein of unknown function (DUF3540)
MKTATLAPVRSFPGKKEAMPHSVQWGQADVSQCLDDASFRLSDGRLARQALSCLITPEAGDQVVVLDCATGIFISHVLQRQGLRAQLAAPGMQTLAITQPSVAIHAKDALALRSLGDIELTSAQGSLAFSARHVLTSASETLVQNAQHLISHAQYCVLQIAALLRMHGKQTLITGDQDMKLDAERVSLG